MPRSALPEHLNDPSEIEAAFPDDSKSGALWRKFKKATKHWFVFGPFATEWWACWRELPITLFKIGHGVWRYEDDVTAFCSKPTWGYLSRVQYWMTWHIQIQWPLFLQIQLWGMQFYIGFKRDQDKVYWLSLFIGRIWK